MRGEKLEAEIRDNNFEEFCYKEDQANWMSIWKGDGGAKKFFMMVVPSCNHVTSWLYAEVNYPVENKEMMLLNRGEFQ